MSESRHIHPTPVVNIDLDLNIAHQIDKAWETLEEARDTVDIYKDVKNNLLNRLRGLN